MSDRPPKKSEKKSETIEIRLDHETKSALQRRARVEGRSVSEILRDLIARYLDAPGASATRSILMRFSIATAAAAALAVSIVGLTSPATAADLSLGVRGMIDTGGAPPFVPQPESSVTLDFGGSQVFCVPRASREPVTLAPAAEGAPCDGYSVLVWAQAGDADHVLIGSRVLLPSGAADQPPDHSLQQGGVLIPIAFGQQGELVTAGNDMPVAVRITFFVQRPQN